MGLLAAFIPTPTAASAQAGDPRAEREKVRAQKAAVASDVDALQADEAEVRAALGAINDNVRGQQAAYVDAQRSATEAQDHATEAAAAAAAKEDEIATLRTGIAEFAVNAYVNPPTEEFLDSFREDSAGEAVRKKSLLSYRSGHDSDLLDELRAAEAELKAIRAEADDAQAEAEVRLGAVSSQLTQLQSAQAQQQQFVSQVESRLDAKLSEAAGLAATDSALSSEIAKQEAAIAAQLRAVPKPPVNVAISSGGGGNSVGSNGGGSNSGGGGGNDGDGGGGGNSGGGGGGGGPITSVPGPPGLTTVGGITVNSRIAGNLSSLLSAASAAGISLGGSGYRDSSGQIALRRQNCGTSDYAIYQMPSSQCSPETARPGLSKHEQGLAVDFTSGGGTLRSGSAAHQWMQANAGSFGWVPLAGEPWHWSAG